MRQDTSKGDGGANERVEFFVTTDSELQVARRDTLDFEILRRIACKLKYLGGQVFEDSGKVDGGLRADARLLAGDGSKMTLYATAGELLRRCQVSALLL